jgi:hypothetical protein
MKRIHLFELEDQPWFPDWIRQRMTAYIQSLHKDLGTANLIVPLVNRGLECSDNRVIDLCSGAGGPMVDVVRIIRSQSPAPSTELLLTDLYPNRQAAEEIRTANESWVRYATTPVDAGNVPTEFSGLRTMVCSLHHMRPMVAQKTLKDAAAQRQPFLAFEISDNSTPVWLWWTAIPVGFLLSLVMTLRMRPVRWSQIIFTYLIPILPLCLAWDGAVSNARTYACSDLKELLQDIQYDDYLWEIDTIKPKGIPIPMLYVLGLPKSYALSTNE